jgi:hypothetical protein
MTQPAGAALSLATPADGRPNAISLRRKDVNQLLIHLDAIQEITNKERKDVSEEDFMKFKEHLGKFSWIWEEKMLGEVGMH